MKTGSLVNLLYDRSTPTVAPTVDMGVTMLSWTDRNPGTVIEVSASGKRIVVQDDNWERTDSNGMSECQEYTFSQNPHGGKHTFTLRKNGKWIRQGESINGGLSLRLGTRERYYDFSR